eukprot:gene8971-1609_t
MKLEDLELGTPLGYGAYSKVVLGTHKKTSQQYAVKVVSKQQAPVGCRLVCLRAHRASRPPVGWPSSLYLLPPSSAPTHTFPAAVRAPGPPTGSAGPCVPACWHGQPQLPRASAGPPPHPSRMPFALREACPPGALLVRHLSPAPSCLPPRHTVSDRPSPDHPNIIKLVACFQTREDIMFVLEYASAGELLEYIKKTGGFEEPVVEFIAAELVNALEYLHSHSIIHRDLKPENILLDGNHHVKLVDFGTARNVSKPDPFQGDMARQMLQSSTSSMSSDLWALGCIIFHMATGMLPFKDPSDYLTFRRILNRDIRWPPNIPPLIKDLGDKLLHIDPTKRLGAGEGGYEKLKAHPFFENICWSNLSESNLKLTFEPEAPVWIPDHSVAECMQCETPFTFFNRKHHCRHCGSVFCAACTPRKMRIPDMYDHKSVRVCDNCYNTVLTRQGQGEGGPPSPQPPSRQRSSGSGNFGSGALSALGGPWARKKWGSTSGPPPTAGAGKGKLVVTPDGKGIRVTDPRLSSPPPDGGSPSKRSSLEVPTDQQLTRTVSAPSGAGSGALSAMLAGMRSASPTSPRNPSSKSSPGGTPTNPDSGRHSSGGGSPTNPDSGREPLPSNADVSSEPAGE